MVYRVVRCCISIISFNSTFKMGTITNYSCCLPLNIICPAHTSSRGISGTITKFGHFEFTLRAPWDFTGLFAVLGDALRVFHGEVHGVCVCCRIHGNSLSISHGLCIRYFMSKQQDLTGNFEWCRLISKTSSKLLMTKATLFLLCLLMT